MREFAVRARMRLPPRELGRRAYPVRPRSPRSGPSGPSSTVSAPTADAVLEALKGVIDPDLGQDIVSLGFITRCNVSEDGAADVVINLTTPACPVKDQLRDEPRPRAPSPGSPPSRSR